MGLDMYAFRSTKAPSKAVDFTDEFASPAPEVVQIAQWRKHPNLHGWMEKLYREKGGTAESFNCTPVVITAEDLDRLEEVVKANTLPSTSGFFFGVSAPEDREDDLAFIAKAREAIAAGETVFYDSWW